MVKYATNEETFLKILGVLTAVFVMAVAIEIILGHNNFDYYFIELIIFAIMIIDALAMFYTEKSVALLYGLEFIVFSSALIFPNNLVVIIIVAISSALAYFAGTKLNKKYVAYSQSD